MFNLAAHTFDSYSINKNENEGQGFSCLENYLSHLIYEEKHIRRSSQLMLCYVTDFYWGWYSRVYTRIACVLIIGSGPCYQITELFYYVSYPGCALLERLFALFLWFCLCSIYLLYLSKRSLWNTVKWHAHYWATLAFVHHHTRNWQNTNIAKYRLS